MNRIFEKQSVTSEKQIREMFSHHDLDPFVHTTLYSCTTPTHSIIQSTLAWTSRDSGYNSPSTTQTQTQIQRRLQPYIFSKAISPRMNLEISTSENPFNPNSFRTQESEGGRQNSRSIAFTQKQKWAITPTAKNHSHNQFGSLSPVNTPRISQMINQRWIQQQVEANEEKLAIQKTQRVSTTQQDSRRVLSHKQSLSNIETRLSPRLFEHKIKPRLPPKQSEHKLDNKQPQRVSTTQQDSKTVLNHKSNESKIDTNMIVQKQSQSNFETKLSPNTIETRLPPTQNQDIERRETPKFRHMEHKIENKLNPKQSEYKLDSNGKSIESNLEPKLTHKSRYSEDKIETIVSPRLGAHNIKPKLATTQSEDKVDSRLNEKSIEIYMEPNPTPKQGSSDPKIETRHTPRQSELRIDIIDTWSNRKSSNENSKSRYSEHNIEAKLTPRQSEHKTVRINTKSSEKNEKSRYSEQNIETGLVSLRQIEQNTISEPSRVLVSRSTTKPPLPQKRVVTSSFQTIPSSKAYMSVIVHSPPESLSQNSSSEHDENDEHYDVQIRQSNPEISENKPIIDRQLQRRLSVVIQPPQPVEVPSRKSIKERVRSSIHSFLKQNRASLKCIPLPQPSQMFLDASMIEPIRTPSTCLRKKKKLFDSQQVPEAVDARKQRKRTTVILPMNNGKNFKMNFKMNTIAFFHKINQIFVSRHSSKLKNMRSMNKILHMEPLNMRKTIGITQYLYIINSSKYKSLTNARRSPLGESYTPHNRHRYPTRVRLPPEEGEDRWGSRCWFQEEANHTHEDSGI